MGKYWCVNQSVLAGALVSSLGWTMTFQLLIIPAVIAAIMVLRDTRQTIN